MEMDHCPVVLSHSAMLMLVQLAGKKTHLTAEITLRQCNVFVCVFLYGIVFECVNVN